MNDIRAKICRIMDTYVAWSRRDVVDHDSLMDMEKLIKAECAKAKEEVYEDVLYRLSFMDAEDTIDDVIADIESRKRSVNVPVTQKEGLTTGGDV